MMDIINVERSRLMSRLNVPKPPIYNKARQECREGLIQVLRDGPDSEGPTPFFLSFSRASTDLKGGK